MKYRSFVSFFFPPPKLCTWSNGEMLIMEKHIVQPAELYRPSVNQGLRLHPFSTVLTRWQAASQSKRWPVMWAVQWRLRICDEKWKRLGSRHASAWRMSSSDWDKFRTSRALSIFSVIIIIVCLFVYSRTTCGNGVPVQTSSIYQHAAWPSFPVEYISEVSESTARDSALRAQTLNYSCGGCELASWTCVSSCCELVSLDLRHNSRLNAFTELRACVLQSCVQKSEVRRRENARERVLRVIWCN